MTESALLLPTYEVFELAFLQFYYCEIPGLDPAVIGVFAKSKISKIEKICSLLNK